MLACGFLWVLQFPPPVKLTELLSRYDPSSCWGVNPNKLIRGTYLTVYLMLCLGERLQAGQDDLAGAVNAVGVLPQDEED